ncbi:SET domain-containing protein [Loa loa]|uniref:SET domain-containing protein n=1 Tax=Loa loa TaxID=7209 RepID=A0A1I7W583_LOALO|nr:SET domain-containing protein [Loa loa]EFO22150.2 SET domain-containing protein [Loa loa]
MSGSVDDCLDYQSCSPIQEEMCLVVDAVERMVKLMSSDCNNPKYCLLQKLSEKQLKTFGIVLAESELEDDDYIHCDLCGVYYRASCRLHPLFIVSDREVREDNKPRAEQTLPAFFEIKTSKIPKAGLGVFAKMDIPIGLVFGPYQGILLSDPKKADQNGYSWEIRISGKPSQYIDGSDPRYSNWMRYINSSRFENEQNLIAFQYNGSVYYRVFRPISEGIELLVWYGNKYGESLGVLSVTQRHKIPPEKNPYIFG